MRARGLTLAVLFCAAAPAAAQPPRLSLPVDCTLGETCFIQQYPDRDPGPGVRDHACGRLSYDGHAGTDFALPSRAAMRAGVTVRAAAPGTVAATRDGMPDIAMNDPEAPNLSERGCGNAVLIDHGDGWQTAYCHMRSGSVGVSPGERVARGATLGRVGLSGRTEFPHLHLGLRHDGSSVDPFRPDPDSPCGTEPSGTLWRAPPEYRPGGMIAAGFAQRVPEFNEIKNGLASPATMRSDVPALVIWGHAFGGREGDEIELVITGPEGEVTRLTARLERDRARFFRAAGRRAQDWAPGRYEGSVTMHRDGSVLGRESRTLTVD